MNHSSRPARANALPLTPALRRILAARLIRSIGQGALAVDFALYTRALHWSPAFLGAVLGAGLAVGAGVTMIVGPLSDRHGRKRFLLSYEALSLAAAILAMATSERWLLAAVAVVAGYGRGQNGAPGLFGAVEQAWLARMTRRDGLGRLYARNAALGFFGTGLGSLLAALPTLWAGVLPGALAYRPLFGLVALAEMSAIALLSGADDRAASMAAREEGEGSGGGTGDGVADRRRETGLLLRLAGINAVNGLGIGLGGPLLTWWFAQRYGVGPGMIGPALAATALLASLSSLLAGRLGRRYGTVRVVVPMRAVGLALLVALPFAPSYPIAMAFYALRMILNRGTSGPRQALAMGLVQPQRQGLAATISSVSTQLPRALGPAAAGLLFGAGALAAPFLLAAVFQGAYLVLYPLVFAAHDPERPRRPAPT